MSTVELEMKPVPQPVLRDSVVDQWNKSTRYYKTLSAEAQDILYWTNYSRRNPKRFWDSVVAPIIQRFPELKGVESASLQTDLYRTVPLPLFKLNEALIKTAQDHSDDMALHNAEPSHSSTNGQTFQDRMRMARIKYCANENLSLGSHHILISIVLLYLDIRLPELGHRKTLLNPSLTEIGIGYAIYSKDQFFMVKDMACSQN
jgi:Cysteine-rich secretory protein family